MEENEVHLKNRIGFCMNSSQVILSTKAAPIDSVSAIQTMAQPDHVSLLKD
jgi:hypothetical protein